MDEINTPAAADLPPDSPAEGAPPPESVEEKQDAAPAAPPVDEPPDPEKIRSEIEGLKRAREEALAEAIKARKLKAEAKAELYRDPYQPPQPLAAKQDDKEPQAGDFNDYEAYVRALADHRASVKIREWEAQQTQRQAQQEQTQRMADLKAKLDDGFARYADFGDVVYDQTATHITPMVVDLLADCESPADVAYYLAKNRVEGVAISRMTPTRAARALAQIEARLSQPAQQQPQARPRTVSAAPAPIAPIGGGQAGFAKDPNKMTNAEFAAWRASQGARRF